MYHRHWRHIWQHIWLSLLLSMFGLGVWAEAQAVNQAMAARTLNARILDAQTLNAWTLHVGQYHNEQRARLQVARLQHMGFDAYLEPSLAGLVRVRVGCFLSPAAAHTTASLLQGRVDAVMVLTPLGSNANVRVCIDQQTGFITPGAWGILQANQQGVVFWIQLAGQTGYVVYHEGWHVSQNEPRSLMQQTSNPREQAAPAFEMAALETTGLAAAEASLPVTVPVVDVVRYRFVETQQDVSPEPSLLAPVVAPAPPVSASNLDTHDLDTHDIDTSTSDTNASGVDAAASRLAASLARLPQRPRVSLQHTEPGTKPGSQPDTALTANEIAQSAGADVTQTFQQIIISSGDILWHNDHEVVVHQQGRLVSLQVVPISSLLARSLLGEAARD